MATPVTTPEAPRSTPSLDEKLSRSAPGKWGYIIFGMLLASGIFYIAKSLSSDLAVVHPATIFPFILLGIALLIALGFEFVNGFLDTANAVATVIYTHSLDPHLAVIYSGVLNFLGVLFSSGAVAFTIIGLLPIGLFLKVSKGSDFSMVFALLLAAILWNLATWWKGLPVSSSHTMIGSIVGVGVANQLMQGGNHVAGMDWEQVKKVFEALLISPVVGFVFAALVFFLFKLVVRDPRLYKAPEGTTPPPFYIRALLILTCGGVSYAHGSNDGQKGMGLIMLILVGTVPTAYALNHTVSMREVRNFAAISTRVTGVIGHYAPPAAALSGNPASSNALVISGPKSGLEHFVATRQYTPQVMLALQQQVQSVRTEASTYGSIGKVPANMQDSVRNQMYVISETLRLLPKAAGAPRFSPADSHELAIYKGYLDKSTHFIPMWVKVAVALALGLGTMVGWKRIVVTVGEKIGKTHMTYAQGASAQLVAMVTILAADTYGLPVSTTHVLNSGVAGTMTANGSGLQMNTIRNIAMAWILTLPAAALLSGSLFWLFDKIVG